MARQPRLVVPAIPVHIVQRGNDRMRCFRDDKDYLVYLALLGDACTIGGCALHAYCLMPNHVHLLATPTLEASCALMMRAVSHRYAQYFNRRHVRTGTLWEGRYRSCLVESSEYLLACHRYIERNPVRAGIVAAPSAYRWSSHAANCGERNDPLVERHEVVYSLGGPAYRQLLAEDLPPEHLAQIREATQGGYPLASQALRTELDAKGRRLERRKPGPPRKARAEPSSVPDPDLFSGGAAS